MSKKLPYMPFYIGDYRKDTGVKALDLEHKGLWTEILFDMWECKERGKLLVNDQVPSDEICGNFYGISAKKFKKMKEKLIFLGVASIDEKAGCLISRRMVRDEKIRIIHSECGKKGGNPSLLKEDLVKDLVNQKDNQTPDTDIENETDTKVFNKNEAFENRWNGYPGKLDGKKAAIRHWNANINTQKDVDLYDLALENYRQSVRNERNNGFRNLNWKNGSTWFNNWKDYIPVEAPQPAPEKPPDQPKPRVPGDPKLEKLWSDCLEMVKTQVSAKNHLSFETTFPRNLENGILLIAVPNQFIRKCLLENYREMIELFLKEISGQTLLVDFCIDSGG